MPNEMTLEERTAALQENRKRSKCMQEVSALGRAKRTRFPVQGQPMLILCLSVRDRASTKISKGLPICRSIPASLLEEFLAMSRTEPRSGVYQLTWSNGRPPRKSRNPLPT